MDKETTKFYLIDCKRFSTILSYDLTEEELKIIQDLRKKLSWGEYSNYLPIEQQVRKDIENYVKKIGKFLVYENTIIDLFD